MSDLDDQVRRADPDRWLATRFVADAAARADLIALYAFNNELARAAQVASQPLIGQIRLVWWREAVEEIAAGKTPRAHPLVQALAAPIRDGRLPAEAMADLAEARMRDLEEWPLGADEIEPYLDATAGRLMALAVRRLAPDADAHAVKDAARAWGLAGLSRSAGRLPSDWDAARTIGQVDMALGAANRALRSLPHGAFPAVAYAALARPYARGKPLSDLGRQARLTFAVARGKL